MKTLFNHKINRNHLYNAPSILFNFLPNSDCICSRSFREEDRNVRNLYANELQQCIYNKTTTIQTMALPNSKILNTDMAASGSWIGTGIKCDGVKPVNLIPMQPSLLSMDYGIF